MKTMFLFSAVVAVAACGGGSGDPDSSLQGTPDMRIQATCNAPSAGYGTVTPAMQAAVQDATAGAGMEIWFSDSQLNADVDGFELQLYNGLGVFAMGMGGVRMGTFQIAGAEAQYATCGLCGLIFTNASMANPPSLMSTRDVWLATSGTVNITSLTPNLTGSVSNLQFQHVTINTAMGYQSTVVGDCATSLTALAFDAVVMQAKPSRPGSVEPITLHLHK